MRGIIKKYLNEAVGVPPEIEKSANKLFYDITNEFDSNNFQDEYHFDNSNGKYSFSDFNFNGIDFEINLQPYSGDELIFAGFGFGNESKVNKRGKLKSKKLSDLYLKSTIAVPESFENINPQDIADLFKNDAPRIISILSHELKHAYDAFKKPEKKVKDFAKYQTYSNFRSGLKPIDELMFNLYYIHAIESIVRPSEIYVLLKENKISRKDFLDFLTSTETYQNLLKIRNFTYQGFRNQLKEMEPTIREIVSNFQSGEVPEDTDELINEFLGAVYSTMSRNTHEIAKRFLISNMAEAFLGLPQYKQEILDDIEKDIMKYAENPLKFYEYVEKMFKFESMKAIKKLSKLYSLIPTEKKDTSINDPMSRDIAVNEVKLGLKKPVKIQKK
jgi:hypothetical protein